MNSWRLKGCKNNVVRRPRTTNMPVTSSLASHTLAMKTEGLVQYGYHTRSSGMCGMLYVIGFNYIH